MKIIRAKHVLVVLAITIILLLSTGCQLPSISIETSPPPAPAQTAPPAETPSQPQVSPINPTWTPPAVIPESAEMPDFISVIARVKPSVVAINTKSTVFNIFTGSTIQEGAGSGWIVSKDGYVVTNNHVVEGAEEVEVTLDDERNFTANVIRTDPLTDLAVVKIDATDLPALQIGDSAKLQVGEWVVAIGNALGLGTSATKGIISALGASVPVSAGQTLTDLIQTDAAINPGNSGGPLVNMKGEVVGINSVKIAEVGVEGIGYSISINTAMPIIEGLIKNGYVIRPWLGVGLYTVDASIARRYNLAVEQGAIITQIASGSPAELAGLKVGDVITSFNGKEVTDLNEMIKSIHASKVGDKAEIEYWRGKDKQSATVIMAQSPPPK
jgi:serine protease Do